ncbi:MAG: hypothetical protein Q8P02_02720 [Candidatus Micrarchaeota archaeon]|nr:hypothetical protein [Candidatus Micrarchaeota archaeon]
MENNVYAALFGLAAFGLLVNIEWLFLTFAFLGVVLLVLGQSAPRHGSHSFPSGGPMDATQFQQPIVVQNSTQSLGHEFMMNIINNQIADTMKKKGH